MTVKGDVIHLCQCPGAYPHALKAGDEGALADCPKCGLSRIVEVFRTKSVKETLWRDRTRRGRATQLVTFR